MRFWPLLRHLTQPTQPAHSFAETGKKSPCNCGFFPFEIHAGADGNYEGRTRIRPQKKQTGPERHASGRLIAQGALGNGSSAALTAPAAAVFSRGNAEKRRVRTAAFKACLKFSRQTLSVFLPSFCCREACEFFTKTGGLLEMAFFPLPTALDQGRAWNLDWRWGGDAARNRARAWPTHGCAEGEGKRSRGDGVGNARKGRAH